MGFSEIHSAYYDTMMSGADDVVYPSTFTKAELVCQDLRKSVHCSRPMACALYVCFGLSVSSKLLWLFSKGTPASFHI